MHDDIDVLVHEVGPRDGLQSIQTIFPTEAKMEWIRREAAAGVPQIQVGSFVPPKNLPQMADSAEVVRQSLEISDLTVAALVPNLRGAENGMAAGAHQIGVVISVSEAHNMSNVKRSVDESLDGFSQIVEYRDAHDDYKDIVLSGGLATAFGCTIDGKVEISAVMRVAEEYLKRGADRLSVADTVGYANPKQVKDLFDELYRTVGTDIAVGAHFLDKAFFLHAAAHELEQLILVDQAPVLAIDDGFEAHIGGFGHQKIDFLARRIVGWHVIQVTIQTCGGGDALAAFIEEYMHHAVIANLQRALFFGVR